MTKPFFDMDQCPDSEGVIVPPAIDPVDLIENCVVPPAPLPVFQCPLPPLPFPGLIGSILIHLQVTARTGIKHDWQAVDPDNEGGWRTNGIAGSAATNSEAYEINGNEVEPGSAVYTGIRAPDSDKVTFWLNSTASSIIDNFKYIKLTAGPDSDGFYSWAEVTPDDWDLTGVTGSVGDGNAAYEVTGFNPIVDSRNVYMARKTTTGRYSFMEPRRTYYIRLTEAPEEPDGYFDWEEVEFDDDAAEPEDSWVTTGFSGTAASEHGAQEQNQRIVPADGQTVWPARQDGKGHMTFVAPMIPWYIKLTAGPDEDKKYEWKQVEQDDEGEWPDVDPPVVGDTDNEDLAMEASGLPAIPDDVKVYLAHRSKSGQVYFNTTDANTGFAYIAPSGGIPARDGSTAGVGTVTLVKINDDLSLEETEIEAEVVNLYPWVVGLSTSFEIPGQAKIINGKLVTDVDPCPPPS